MSFSPRPASERVQVRIFSGSETLVTPFTAVFLRFGPDDVQAFVNNERNVEETAVDPRLYRRANELFTALVGRSFSLDLSDLSRDTWSLHPRLRRSDRRGAHAQVRHAHLRALEQRGRGHHAVRPRAPAQHRGVPVGSASGTRGAGAATTRTTWSTTTSSSTRSTRATSPSAPGSRDGRRCACGCASFMLGDAHLRLAEPLVVRSVRSERHGRLLAIRVRNQNNVLVSLPKPLSRDDVITLTVAYAGRLEAQPPDREVVELDGAGADRRTCRRSRAEPRWVLSNRTHWYPQNTVSDYATGVLRLTVPAVVQTCAPAVTRAGQSVTAAVRRRSRPRRPARTSSTVASRRATSRG